MQCCFLASSGIGNIVTKGIYLQRAGGREKAQLSVMEALIQKWLRVRVIEREIAMCEYAILTCIP